MNRLNELYSIRHDSVIEVLENIYNAVNGKKDITKYIPQLSDTIDQLKNAEGDEYKEIHDSTGELLNSILKDSNSIMMALQVQDITSQKIAAVNYLLEAITEKIRNILIKFQPTKSCSFVNKDINNSFTFVSTLHRPIGFNPEDIDIVINEDDCNFSHDEIEAIFGAVKK
jgi:chemotaxis regulatin CheY-phosphate phosphatase CheZ